MATGPHSRLDAQFEPCSNMPTYSKQLGMLRLPEHVCASTWYVKEYDISKQGWQVAQCKFSNRPSEPATSILCPSDRCLQRTHCCSTS